MTKRRLSSQMGSRNDEKGEDGKHVRYRCFITYPACAFLCFTDLVRFISLLLPSTNVYVNLSWLSECRFLTSTNIFRLECKKEYEIIAETNEPTGDIFVQNHAHIIFYLQQIQNSGIRRT